MLQYALLHLYGFGLTIDDLKAFRVSLTAQSCNRKRPEVLALTTLTDCRQHHPRPPRGP